MPKEKPYFSIQIKEINEPLVELSEEDFVLDFNYYKKGFTNEKKALVRKTAREKLLDAARNLPKGYKFKIYDAWRSKQTQQKMINWFVNQIRTEHPDWSESQTNREVLKFTAPITNNPTKPLPHNTGGAIDLTIVGNSGKELEMGSDFDEPSERSFFKFFESKNPSREKGFHKSRQLLRGTLTYVGFAPNNNEWWHFDFWNQRWAYYYKKPFAFYGSTNYKLND